MQATRVLVIADIRLYREGLAELLERQESLTVVGTAAGLDAALDAAGGARADVALLDMAMPDGVSIARALAHETPSTCVVALGMPDEERHVVTCAEAGIVGYVAREASLADLIEAIEAVARGEARCSPRVAGSLLRRLGALSLEHDTRRADSALTARELEIVGLIDRGLSNKEIAHKLYIEVPTVKNHVHHILEKLGVNRRTQAAARVRAMRHGSRGAA